MRNQLLAIALAMAASACTSTPPIAPAPAIEAPLCAPGVQLGAVAVVPLTHWRPDQKEPAVREAIAQRAIEAVLPATPCASTVKVLPMAADAQAGERLALARGQGARTTLLIRIEELGPIMVLSFPALWSTWSDVVFTLEAVDAETGARLRSIPHHRRKGGAFEARGLEPLQGEMEQALRDVISGAQ